ncbi:MAG: hypothetical protein AMXMBFR47_39160 [Planctomycetota bacterium]
MNLNALIALWLSVLSLGCASQTLEVKPERTAIIKNAPTGDASLVGDPLPAGTQVAVLGSAPRYWKIQVPDGRVGWSYKGNFIEVAGAPADPGTGPPTAASLLARRDALQIVVIDVEVGDATLIICPEEDGQRDILLIDTGEDDSDRIFGVLAAYDVASLGKPITRFFITHYDFDHFGDADEIIPLSQVVYDHGDNIKKSHKRKYQRLVSQPGVDRRLMTLDYLETFSGGVTVDCVAVNQATDCDPSIAASPPDEDNPNSIALIISWRGFDYFTGGDLTFKPETSLANCIRNCDVYHVNHHGSRATSSDLDFVKKLDPEVSIASNGARHGHPSADVANRLITDVHSAFFQTNCNLDSRAHHPDPRFVGDDSFHEDDELEDAEGATGTITVVVDGAAGNYYIVMPGLNINDGTFPIEP